MSHIAVLGLGNFGTAITRLWGDAGHHIQAWTATQEVFDSIHDKGTNEKYLPGVPLKATVTMDLSAGRVRRRHRCVGAADCGGSGTGRQPHSLSQKRSSHSRPRQRSRA